MENGVYYSVAGYVGKEAYVKQQLRVVFPGIGGTIVTNDSVVTALREDLNPTEKNGHRMFILHTLIKKFEDYFRRKNVFYYDHVPRPLGSISRVGDKPYEASLYEWVFGTEFFPWRIMTTTGEIPISLSEWDKFVGNFAETGINIARDTTDADDSRISKNIIHEFHHYIGDGYEMAPFWKRIDFGHGSITVDYNAIARFLRDNKSDLRKVLRGERFEMMLLALEYLIRGKEMGEEAIKRLQEHIADYRRSSLSIYVKVMPHNTPINPSLESLI